MEIYWLIYGTIPDGLDAVVDRIESESTQVESPAAYSAAPSSGITYKVTLNVQPDDSSYRYVALMEKPQLTLKFSLPRYVEIPVGAWCIYENQKFTLNAPQNIKKNGIRNIEYTLLMGTAQDSLGAYKFRNSVDKRLKFSMCAKPKEFLNEIVANLNEREGANVWTAGEPCLDASEKTIEFNHVYIDEALQSIADEFETEFEITDAGVIYLGKVEHFKDNPLALSYGRGNGFVPGLGRTTLSDEMPIRRLYVQGTDQNIDRSQYGGLTDAGEFATEFEYTTTSAELRLPPFQKIIYDGEHFAYLDEYDQITDEEDGFDEDAAREYRTDENGYYVERYDSAENDTTREDSLDCSEIYPSFVGEVDSVITANEEKNFYDVTDLTIPAALNFNDYVIAGENMTIIFQSGMLAGKEFEVKYKHTDNDGQPLRKWEIVPQEIDGYTMPGGAYMPAVGDKYAVFGIMLPPAYICNNAEHTGASWDMLREAVKKLYEREEQKFTFTGQIQGKWAKDDWVNLGGRLIVGGYVLFSDNQFAPDGTLIRITGVKDFVNNPYSPTIEISNTADAGGSSVRSDLLKIENTEVMVDDSEKRMKLYTKRRFRDALETIDALDEAMLDGFSSSVNPVAIQTMQTLVGTESLQFRFVTPTETDGKYTYAEAVDPVTFNATTKKVTIPQCYIQHLTLGLANITSQRNPDSGAGYKIWQMGEFSSATLTSEQGRLYLYAKVPKATSASSPTAGGEFRLESNAHAIDGGTHYWLLTGILSSECDGVRSYASLYGFTEILPGRITTDKIVSSNGTCYFDLARNEIGGAIKFLSENNSYITLIDGGKIKSSLIDADGITARRLEVRGDDPNNQTGVDITPEQKAISIKDSSGDECSSIEGIVYESKDDLLGGASNADSIAINNREDTCYGYGAGVCLNRGSLNTIHGLTMQETRQTYQIVLATFSTDKPAEVTITGNVVLDADSAQPTSSSGEMGEQLTAGAYASMDFYIETYASQDAEYPLRTIAIKSLMANANYYEENTYSHASIDQSITAKGKTIAGYHKLILIVDISANLPTDSASLSWGNTNGSRTDLAASYKCDFYVSRYFANGFCLGIRNDNYGILFKDGINGMRFMWANNGYEVDFSKDGIRYKVPQGEGQSDWKYLT